MHKYIIKAVVDTREQKFVQKSVAFFKTKNVDVETKPLNDFGDVAVFLKTKEWLNIERKSIVDFVTSYISGHIQDQCIRMNKKSEHPCIIVHGTLEDLKRVSYQYPALKRIKQSSIDKMRDTIELIYRTPVFFVEKDAHYFLKIMKIAEILCEKSQETLQNKQAKSSKYRADVNLVMQANGVGEKTALLLLKEFHTPERVLNASREDLLKINGIGDSTISDLKKLKKVYYEGV